MFRTKVIVLTVVLALLASNAAADSAKVVLIVDEQSVESVEGVTFHLNQARKHEENPVLIPGRPHEVDSLQVSWPSTTIYDPVGKKFMCYYSGMDVIQYDSRLHPKSVGYERWLGRLWRYCYAQSQDGVHWEKPKLGQYTHRGIDTNRIVSDYEAAGDGVGWNNWCRPAEVWLNPEPKSPDEKFLAIFCEIGSDGKGNRSFKLFQETIYQSPDGKAWTRTDQVVYDGSNPAGAISEDLIDVNTVVHDPGHPDPQRRVQLFGQSCRSQDGGRAVSVVSAGDFDSIEMTKNRHLLLRNDPEIEDELHWNKVRRMQNGYYLVIHDSSHLDYTAQKPPTSDIRMGISTDGIDFRRLHRHTPLIPRGKKGEWDHNFLVCGDIVEFGDTVHFYYHGCSIIWRPWPSTESGVDYVLRGSNVYPVYMGLATVPRDRFAYAATVDGGEGQVVTRPVDIPVGGKLWVNSELTDGGAVLPVLLDDQDQVIATGKLTDTMSQTVYRLVEWDQTPPGGEYRVQVSLSGSARLFSIKVTAQ